MRLWACDRCLVTGGKYPIQGPQTGCQDWPEGSSAPPLTLTSSGTSLLGVCATRSLESNGREPLRRARNAAGIPGAKLHPKSQSYDSKLQTWCARWQVKTNLLRGGGQQTRGANPSRCTAGTLQALPLLKHVNSETAVPHQLHRYAGGALQLSGPDGPEAPLFGRIPSANLAVVAVCFSGFLRDCAIPHRVRVSLTLYSTTHQFFSVWNPSIAFCIASWKETGAGGVSKSAQVVQGRRYLGALNYYSYG
eukprot:CAMPEP_0174335310 /NCGR_PEP_ID=MMETSP0810-20121108/20670_1 /TAXON_ID=73025 ORGANISM="Eutreptiella gymnastica-like, Strain CCMP1594" /NCGR_SAMPLE_ID=MMETSP0810 /ASSEMBLY_ACC=CAM_ASM_000659 /LENGTH=248 /DNA_ID=CAMNT_0015453591 /DNA_START=383 /DNA_END=1129 /DNA_ORIENTATION=+